MTVDVKSLVERFQKGSQEIDHLLSIRKETLQRIDPLYYCDSQTKQDVIDHIDRNSIQGFGRGRQYLDDLPYGIKSVRSQNELNFIRLCEQYKVKTLLYETIELPYQWENSSTDYTVDFLVDNKYLLEIKWDNKWVRDERMKFKVDLAQKYAKSNNFKFFVLTRFKFEPFFKLFYSSTPDSLYDSELNYTRGKKITPSKSADSVLATLFD